MASRQPLQSSFAFGEMSPRLRGRSDTERYRQSLAICENVITLSHGNALKRPGTSYIEKSPTEGAIRLFDLQSDLGNPYVIEVGWRTATGSYVRVLDREGYEASTTQFVMNPSFTLGLDDWTDASDAQASVTWDAAGWAVFNTAPQGGGRTARLQQEVTVDDPTVLHRLEVGTFIDDDDLMVINIGTTAGASDLASFVLPTGISQVTFTPGAGNATFWLSFEVPYDAGNDIAALDYASIVDNAATIFEAAAPWSETDLVDLTATLSTQEVALYFAQESHPPQRIVIDNGIISFEAVPFVDPPASWAAGNYPRAVTFHQQRLWYAGTPQDPDTLWASQTADFFNFALGTGQPTDSIQFEMADRGSVTWINGARDLLIGTDVAEHIITSEGGVIIPGDIQSQQQSSYGSAIQRPVEVGNGVLYVGNDRRRVRFMNYQFLEEGWVSLDITWPSEHVTRAIVREMHFKYAPDPLIWLVLGDGTLVSAVYEREQNNLVGWHRHPLPEGRVKSAALAKVGSGIELWVAIERVVDGSLVTNIERTVNTVETGANSSIQLATTNFTDSKVQRPVEIDGTTGLPFVSVLDHLEGFEVQIVVAGAVHPPRTVTLGRIDLQQHFAKEDDVAVVGLGYTGRMATLPLEGVNQGGTAQAVQKRRNRIFVRLLESAIPVVNGVTDPIREPSMLMDEAPDLFTGDIQVAGLGWDRIAEVGIEMPDPLPYNVLSIFGDAEGETFGE